MRHYNHYNKSRIQVSELPDVLLKDIYGWLVVKECFIDDDGSDLVYYILRDTSYYETVPANLLKRLCLIHRFYEIEVDVRGENGETEYEGICFVFHYYKGS